MELYDLALASSVPDDPYIATALGRYFPGRLSERFGAQLKAHPLKREIIATQVVNSMINRVGPTFVHRIHEETGAAPPDIVRAYLGARQIFDLAPLWSANEALDGKVGVKTQNLVVLTTVRLLVRATLWLLQHRAALADLEGAIARFAPGVAEVAQGLERWLAPPEKATLDADTARLVATGVPDALAARVARLEPLFAALDVVEVSGETGQPVETVACVYFGVGGRLELGWLSQQISALPADTHWQSLARAALRDDLSLLARALAGSVLRGTDGARDAAPALIERWASQRPFQLGRCRQLMADLKASAPLDLAMLSVLLRELRGSV